MSHFRENPSTIDLVSTGWDEQETKPILGRMEEGAEVEVSGRMAERAEVAASREQEALCGI